MFNRLRRATIKERNNIGHDSDDNWGALNPGFNLAQRNEVSSTVGRHKGRPPTTIVNRATGFQRAITRCFSISSGVGVISTESSTFWNSNSKFLSFR